MLQTRYNDGSSASFNLLNNKIKSHFCHYSSICVIIDDQIAILTLFNFCVNHIIWIWNKSSSNSLDIDLPDFFHLTQVINTDIFAANHKELFVELRAVNVDVIVLRYVEHILVSREVRVCREISFCGFGVHWTIVDIYNATSE